MNHFCLVCLQVNEVNRTVVPQVPCWVEAWALWRRNFPISSLSCHELASLINVSHGVSPNSHEILTEGWSMKEHVDDDNRALNKAFVYFDPENVKQEAKVQDIPCGIPKSKK